MGRPRKSEPRDRQLNVSLTAAEYESIAQRARALGMRPVHFGREKLLDRDRPVSPSRADGNHVVRLYVHHLSRLGNLLNQTVRHLHQTGDPLPADLEPLLKDIRQIIARGVPQ
jgi:hypothetical protein